MKTTVTIMVVNKHMYESVKLRYKNEKECLLSHRIHFSRCDSPNKEFEKYDPDGSYIVYDSVREVFIRAGAAVMGIL